MKYPKTDPTRTDAFESEAEFSRRLRAYLKFCDDPMRLPNSAGFCRFCGIRRDALTAMKERFPLAYDLMESTFLDEALNRKVPNPAATMAFFYEQVEKDGGAAPHFQIICAHDAEQDGA